MGLLKYFITLISLFFVILFVSVAVYFVDIRNDMATRFISDSNRSIGYIENTIKENLLDNNSQKINSIIETATKVDSFDNITVKYKRFVFTADALFNNSKSIAQKGWAISDVTIDIKDGEINQLNEKYFEFIPVKNYDIKNKLLVKLQVMKGGDVENYLSELDYFASSQKETQPLSAAPSWFVSIFGVTMPTVSKEIIIEEMNIAKITYVVNATEINQKIFELFLKVLIYSLVLFAVIFAVFIGFKKYILVRDVLKPLRNINTYMDDILDNRFKKIKGSSFAIKEVDELASKINKASVKLAGLVSEVNVNRDMIDRKISTDDLTGLANQKVFEMDMKAMFITNSSGYVAVLKLENLAEFVKNSSTSLANNLIEDFAHGILNCIYEISKTSITLYRFYGSEFAIIAKKIDHDQMDELCKKVMVKLSLISRKYGIKSSLSHIGATPFEEYGTTETIIKHANLAYKKACDMGENLYYIVVEDELKQKANALEHSVRTIIENKMIDLSYTQDTYSMYSANKLLMKETTPEMVDEHGEKIPIGTFISAAEKLSIADKFDKLVVEKVIKNIIDNEIEYFVAINLSMKSIQDEEFKAWLEGQLVFNSDIAKYIVFSITSYSAHTNIDLFRQFTNDIHRFGSKIILKRYSYGDFKLEDLKDLNLDFIRLQRDYTIGIAQDREKKHIVKNIIAFGESNEVFILGDSVKSDDDFNTLDLLGLYGTSR